MAKVLPKQNTETLLAKEENLLNWDEILDKFKKAFGHDIYESWIKKNKLKKGI